MMEFSDVYSLPLKTFWTFYNNPSLITISSHTILVIKLMSFLQIMTKYRMQLFIIGYVQQAAYIAD